LEMRTLTAILVLTSIADAAATGYTASCPATAEINIAVVCSLTLTPVPSYFTESGGVITFKPGSGFKSSINGPYRQSIGSFGISYLATGTRLGDVSISFTNSQGWTDPPPQTIRIVPVTVPPRPGLQPVLVQHATGSSRGECCQTVTLAISPTAGHMVFVGAGMFANPAVPFTGPTLNDNLGDRYTADTGINYSYNGTHQYVALFHFKAPAGVTSLTLNRNDGVNQLMLAIAGEFTNIQDNPVDQMDVFGNDYHGDIPGCAGACWIAGPVSTSNTTDLIIGMAYTVDGCVTPPGDSRPPYSLVASIGDCTVSPTMDSASMVYAVVNARGGYTATGTGSIAVSVAGSYKAVTGTN
jgi:hypothetical protein